MLKISETNGMEEEIGLVTLTPYLSKVCRNPVDHYEWRNFCVLSASVFSYQIYKYLARKIIMSLSIHNFFPECHSNCIFVAAVCDVFCFYTNYIFLLKNNRKNAFSKEMLSGSTVPVMMKST